MSKFQIVTLGICIVCIASGLLVFSAFKGKQKPPSPTIKIWGTLDEVTMNNFVANVTRISGNKYKMSYTQMNPATMYNNYIQALVSGTGPDVLLLPENEIYQYQTNIVPIPYTNISQDTFKSTFIQEAELYLGPTGVAAIPFTVDPLVMYWNRDMFSNALIASPPKYWSDFMTVAPQLTQKDQANNILRSGLGIGEYQNVDHAKEILSTLIMQAGSPITSLGGDHFYSYLSGGNGGPESPSGQALTFFTQFANPINQVYSWNRSLPDTATFFISNKLAVYFGFASEYQQIHNMNPNLDYDVAVIPQLKPTGSSQPLDITYGNLYGFSLAKGSPNSAAALETIFYVLDPTILPLWVQQTGLPSVRRDELGNNQSSAEASVFATSALWSRGWLDPDPTKTSTIFQNMVENITSGSLSIDASLNQANSQMQYLLTPTQ